MLMQLFRKINIGHGQQAIKWKATSQFKAIEVKLTFIFSILLVLDIYRSFLLSQYYIFKRSSKIEMSFFFYINNGFASLASLQHFQPFCANYHNNEEIYPYNNYPLCQGEHNTQVQTIENPSPPQENLVQPSEIIRKKQRKAIQRTVSKQILSARKNSESNIINQFYSFFSCRQKSQRIVYKCVGKRQSHQAQAIVQLFYASIKLINAKRGRKYVNTAKFVNLFTEEVFSEQISQMKDQIMELNGLSAGQICLIFRKCASYYLQQVSISSILTSKRISAVSKKEHLTKRRKIVKAILSH